MLVIGFVFISEVKHFEVEVDFLWERVIILYGVPAHFTLYAEKS